jgi:TRAP-type mannitol/chloroaromatic compound transport system substrate-binding protein
VVLVPGAEIVQSLRSGAIDACEWIGPWLDTAMGLHEAAGYYYSPGWHEPGTALALGINKRVWESFDKGDQRPIEAAAAAEYAVSLAEFNTNNALAMRRLEAEGTVKIRKFGNAILKSFAEISREVVAETGAGGDLSRKIYESYLTFRDSIQAWTAIAEGAYLGARTFG